jgi:hypothetical protein
VRQRRANEIYDAVSSLSDDDRQGPITSCGQHTVRVHHHDFIANLTSIFRGGKKDLGGIKMDRKLRDLISERFYGIKRGEREVDENVDISEKKWDSYDKEKVDKMVQEWGKVHRLQREIQEELKRERRWGWLRIFDVRDWGGRYVDSGWFRGWK